MHDENPSIVGPTGPNTHNGSIQWHTSGGKTPYKYHWSTGSIQPFLSNLATGYYACTITDALGCTLVAEHDLLVPTHALPGTSAESMQVSPNPSTGTCRIKALPPKTGEATLRVLDVLGRQVFQEKLALQATFEQTLDLRGLAEGIYRIELVGERWVMGVYWVRVSE